MEMLDWYWNEFLGAFAGVAADWFNQGQPFSPLVTNLVKGGFTLAILFAVYEVYLFFMRRVRKRRLRQENILEGTDAAYYADPDSQFVQSLEATKDLEGTIAPLKKAKRYDRIGEIYAAVNQPKEAARWFRKAGDRKRAGMELAKAGLTVRAARMLMRAGDYATAARFFEEKGRHKAAAKAYEKLGDPPAAAAAYARAGRTRDAVSGLLRYFGDGRPDTPEQLRAAEQCYALLADPTVTDKMPEADRKRLKAAVALRFEHAERLDLAAQLYVEGGQPGRAGDLYLRLGRREDAARCLRQAGRTPPNQPQPPQ